MVTLSDVAKKANVSKMTVSRVINHPELVTEELRKFVYQAMEDLNYQPNVAAKALASKRSHVVTVYILEEIDTTEPYYMNLLMGIARSAAKAHFSLQLVTLGGVDHGTSDGYIITGVRQKDFSWIKTLEKPVVLFGENNEGLDFIDSDNCYGTATATEHALTVGYDQVIYIGIDVEEPFEVSREQGYLKVMAEKQRPAMVYRFKNRSTATRNFIETNWHKFTPNTCFVCSSDRLAMGIERGIINSGGDLPTEYGVIGYDGVFLDQVSSPKLTTMKQAIVKMGEACGEMLVNKITEGGVSQGQRLFLPELIVRESTKKK